MSFHPPVTVTGASYLSVDANQTITAQGIPQMVILAGLSIAGTYYPNNFVGPSYADASSAAISSYGTGAGFFRVVRDGTLQNFAWTNASSSGSDVPAQIWLAPAGNPSLFAYTGISITMPAGAYVTINSIDILNVVSDDLIVVYNNDLLIGYTPGTMTISAEYIAA